MAVEQAKGIPGSEVGRTIGVIAAPGAVDGKTTRQALEGAQRPEGTELAAGAERVGVGRHALYGQGGRETVDDLQPGERQELLVAHFEGELHGLAEKSADFAEAALVVQPVEAELVPEPGDGRHHKQGEGRGEQKAIADDEAGEGEHDAEHEPGLAELRILAEVYVAAVAQLAHDTLVEALGRRLLRRRQAQRPSLSRSASFGGRMAPATSRYSTTGTGTASVISATTWAGKRPRRRVCGLMCTRWASTAGQRCCTSLGMT